VLVGVVMMTTMSGSASVVGMFGWRCVRWSVGDVWECACACACDVTKSGSEGVWHASIES